MICRGGRIVHSDGDRVDIAIANASQCARCQSGQGCGFSLLARWLAGSASTLSIPLPEHYPIGQLVRLEVGSIDLARATLGVYGPPLVGLIVGIAAGQTAGEGVAVLGGLAGTGIGVWLSRTLDHRPRIRITPAEPVT